MSTEPKHAQLALDWIQSHLPNGCIICGGRGHAISEKLVAPYCVEPAGWLGREVFQTVAIWCLTCGHVLYLALKVLERPEGAGGGVERASTERPS
jgi:hypothetical protein